MARLVMSFLPGQLYYHYRRRQERRALARAAALGPTFEHPVLGVGGQSIELSMALGKPVSAAAVTVAVDDFHLLLLPPLSAGASDNAWTHADLLEAARFLTSVAVAVDVPDETRALLAADLTRLESH